MSLALSFVVAALTPGAASADPPSVPTYTVGTQGQPFDGLNTLEVIGDEDYASVTAPFPVPFYGQTYTTLWVESNGQVHFGDPGTTFPDEDLEAIPSSSTPNGVVYVFGDDLVVDRGSVVRTAVLGTAPNRRLLIEWHKVRRMADWADQLSAEVIFHESGQITFNYTGLDNDDERGAKAVVGVENAAGSAATQVLYRQPLLQNDTAIVFQPQGSPASSYTYTSQAQPFDTFTSLDLMGDDDLAAASLPFAVPFYGAAYSSVWVDTNGQVAFTNPGQSHSDNDLEALPSPSAPNATVYVFGDDLLVGPGSVVRTAVSGSAPNRQFLIEWHHVARFASTADVFSAEVVLGENGTITLNYSGLDNDREKGAHAVVGVESPSGLDAVQFLFHQALLANDTAVVFTAQNVPPPYTARTEPRPYEGLSTIPLWGDDEYTGVDLPFPVPFYGQPQNKVWVDTNGYLTFADPGQSHAEFTTGLPSAAAPNGAIYAFGGDLWVGAGSVIRTAQSGTAPNRQFLIEWHNAYLFGNPANRFSVEVILAESGQITLNYAGLDNDNERGTQALVGVENADGSAATQVVYHQPLLNNDTAIVLHPQGSPVTSYTHTTQPLPFDTFTSVDLTGDDETAAVTVPFPMPFYGLTYTGVWVDTNGLLYFTNPGQSFTDGDLEAIPSPSTPNAAVYVFADDLWVGPGSIVRTATSGTAPNRKLTIEWHNVSRFNHAPGHDDRLNAQVTLAENGEITLNYSGMDVDSERGAAAQVGIENAGGGAATQVLYHEPLLRDNTAVVLEPHGLPQNHTVTTEGPAGVSAVIQAPQPIHAYQVDIQPDALASRLAVTKQVSPAFDINLDDGLSFTSAQITIPYNPARLGSFNPANLRIYHLNDKYGLWVPVTGTQTVNTTAHTVTATVDHLSTFTVLKPDDSFADYWATKPVWCVPPGSGPASNLDIALIIDRSSSMLFNDPNDLRLTAAKLFVDSMRETDRVAVVGFADDATTHTGLTTLGTQASVAAVKTAIDQAQTIYGGQTNISSAVYAGVAALTAGGATGRPRIAILLTDGDDDAYDHAATTAAHDNNVVYVTIGLGQGIEEQLLTSIAADTGGRYLHLDQASQLPALYAELANDLVDPDADADADGLTDCIERRGALIGPGVYAPDTLDIFAGRYITSNPTNPDTDGEGLQDGAELGPALDLRDDPDIATTYAFLINAGITRIWNPIADPRYVDTDSDALTDLQEVQMRDNGLPVDPLRRDEFIDDDGYMPLNLPAFTIFVPDNNSIPASWLNPIVVWNHDTHLCVSNCTVIYDWAQARYQEGGGWDWFHAIYCNVADCTPQDIERGLIETIVDRQGIFTRNGGLQDAFVERKITERCWETKEVPTSDCQPRVIEDISKTIDQLDHLFNIIDTVISALPGGQRRALTPQQDAAKTRVEQLAKQACQDVARGANETAQAWGTRVHQRFETLIQQERGVNPKLWGETGYNNGNTVSKNGNAWPAGTSAPDAVYGVAQETPELLFDLKTGARGLPPKWLHLLGLNLPNLFSNVPVYKVTC